MKQHDIFCLRPEKDYSPMHAIVDSPLSWQEFICVAKIPKNYSERGYSPMQALVDSPSSWESIISVGRIPKNSDFFPVISIVSSIDDQRTLNLISMCLNIYEYFND